MPGSAGLLADLEGRGLVQDCTDRAELSARLAAGPMTLYCGFDPTADSLHVGHLLGVVTLRRFQRAGHRPIAVVGGATGMVGDPSGRSDERSLLDPDVVAANVAAIRRQLESLLASGPGERATAVVLDNAMWTGRQSLLGFLRDVGKHVTVGQMMAKEPVRARMAGATGISFTEFAYMLLQANDYLWLHTHEGCELQVGGSDQWGNITAGTDLIRRVEGGKAFGLVTPLVSTSDGRKMGKSEAGAVWLDRDRTSPLDFYQWWVNTTDDDISRFLRIYTFLPEERITDLTSVEGAALR
ncbi:MAG: tyrosine--tRNA ligase, partial [Acidimicrobiales bacterium]